VFAACEDLAAARGLDELRHLGPSSLDLYTLEACGANLPPAFLDATRPRVAKAV